MGLEEGKMERLQRLAAGILIASLATAGLFASDSHETSFKAFSRDFLKDAGQIWSYPVHIKGRDVLPLTLLATTVAILIPNDEKVYGNFRDYRDRHGWVGDVSPVLGQMGFIGAGGVMGVFLGVGLLGKNPKATETALLAGSAVLQCFLVNQVAQGLSGRQVPKWEDGVDHWAGPSAFFARHKNGEGRHYGAFPSGHTATAFCLATVMDMQYGERIWVPIAAYTVATGVGLAMMMQGEHWLSDVVVGAVIGNVISRMVVNNHRKRHNVQPSVAIGPHGISVGAFCSFN
jgi:membrane-associated phospholipid phosphatase